MNDKTSGDGIEDKLKTNNLKETVEKCAEDLKKLIEEQTGYEVEWFSEWSIISGDAFIGHRYSIRKKAWLSVLTRFLGKELVRIPYSNHRSLSGSYHILVYKPDLLKLVQDAVPKLSKEYDITIRVKMNK